MAVDKKGKKEEEEDDRHCYSSECEERKKPQRISLYRDEGRANIVVVCVPLILVR